MGGNMSRVVGCFVPHDKVAVFLSEPLDEGLGHSFCYVRPVSASSPPHSDTEAEPPNNGVLRQNNADNGSCSHEPHRQRNVSETSFKAISGASVSANTSTPRTITSREQFSSFANVSYDRAAAFEGTASFSSLPLQPVPRGLSQSGPITGSQSGQPSGPLDRGFLSGPIERGFMSGPLERGFLSGPLERGCVSAPMEATDRGLFSAPLSGSYYAAYFRRRRRSLAQLVRNLGHPVKKALSRSLSKTTSSLARTQRSLTAPVKLLWGHTKDIARDGANQYDCPLDSGSTSSSSDSRESRNLQWAQGKAGEDRVHVVLSEEHGWLFVGIYDGFNGPDAPDFLMSNLYQEVYKELRGLLWDRNETPVRKEGEVTLGTLEEGKHSEEHFQGLQNTCNFDRGFSFPAENLCYEDHARSNYDTKCAKLDGCSYPVQDGTCGTHAWSRDFSCEKLRHSNSDILETIHQWSSSGDETETQGELCGLSSCKRYSTDGSSKKIEPAGPTIHCQDYEAITMKNGEEPNLHQHGKKSMPRKHWKIWSGRSLLEFKLRKAHREGKEQIRRLSPSNSESEQDSKGRGNNFEENHKLDTGKLCKSGNANHSDVLKALASALASTERAYLQMADHSMEEMPELALMGSCVLVMLMKGEDVYVMNVGDSRAVLAQAKSDSKVHSSSSRGPTSSQLYDAEKIGARDSQLRQELERIMEETPTELETFESSHTCSSTGPPATSLLLSALQLSADHSTNVEEEVLRIKAEHPDDKKSISNERVKGRLKVTRAFGAGFLKMPRWNNALLEMFRVDYVGTAPYVTCIPALHHHSLGPNDRFLVLSSDGLYQYLSNEEVVSQVEWFMENYPDGDPAQYLIEELLFRAAKKAGMDFHELLDIPQGDRRKYHDDVSVMVISLEGRIWRSFG